MRTIPVSEFGKDHWALLAYIETRVVSYPDGHAGTLDPRHLRCNPNRHPLFNVNHREVLPEYEHSTRLRKVAGIPSQEAGHDDYDCLDDLEAAGLIWGLTGLYSSCYLSAEGERLAKAIRFFKAEGGNYADFIPAIVN